MAFDATFDELLAGCQRSAVHLEMRDVYTPNDPNFLAWASGERFDPAERWSGWLEKIRAVVERGVQVRRARIVSEPVTEYIKFEYDVTAGLNVAAGEQVRWLPRRRAADLLVPACDLWIFDDRVVLFNHFAGDGAWPADGIEIRNDELLAKRFTEAFEAIWQHAIAHEDYQPV